MKPIPPKNAVNFLRWFCREDCIEEIEGDLTEVFEKQYEQSPTRAQRKFFWSVIRYLRPEFIKSFKTSYQPNIIAMFRHNFLMTYRNFKRYKSSFFINLIGLSTGLACALLIYLWVADELRFDKFHEKDSQLFQVMERREFPDRVDISDESSGMLAETLAEERSEIEYATAVAPAEWFQKFTLSVGDNKNLKATGQYVGKDFFNIFSFKLIAGNRDQVLADKNAMVISDDLAMRLFGTTQGIIGKTVRFQQKKDFFISGIFETIPFHSSQQFDFILSFEYYKDVQTWVTTWRNTGPHNYVILRKGTNIEEFNNGIAGVIARNCEDTYRTAFVLPFSDNYLYNTFDHGVRLGGRIEYIKLFSIIAIFILVVACVNFMNLSTAKAMRRTKEVGVKKAMGAVRKQLIFQYLGESVLLTFLSVIFALFLVALLIPQFNELTAKHVTLTFAPRLVLTVIGITLFTGFISGSYPALYLSGFNPVTVLKGKLPGSIRELLARKGLIVFQFVISVILIVAVQVVYRQFEYIQKKDPGYSKDNIIRFDSEGGVLNNQETFLGELKKIPGIINASGTWHNIVGRNFAISDISWPGKDPDEITFFEGVGGGYDFIETLGMKIASGRNFSRDFSDEFSKIILNEAAVDVIDLEDPIGQTLKFGEQDIQIIGVVKNFHFQSLHENVKPLYITLATQGATTWYKIIAKIEAGRERETIERLKKFYTAYNPGFVLDYYYLDEAYQKQYVAEMRLSVLLKYFAGMAIIISCLGLFGLISFTTERRLKEIGIRKILGSSALGIVRLLSTDFTKMVLIAILVALPVGYMVARNWLNDFAYKIDLEWWYFAGAGLAALLIAWLSVGFQTIKATRVNPVECLKDE